MVINEGFSHTDHHLSIIGIPQLVVGRMVNQIIDRGIPHANVFGKLSLEPGTQAITNGKSQQAALEAFPRR